MFNVNVSLILEILRKKKIKKNQKLFFSLPAIIALKFQLILSSCFSILDEWSYIVTLVIKSRW